MSDDKASEYVSNFLVICSLKERLEDVGTVGESLMPQTCSHSQRALVKVLLIMRSTQRHSSHLDCTVLRLNDMTASN